MFLNGKLVRPKFGQNFSSEFLNYAVYTEFVATVGMLRKKTKKTTVLQLSCCGRNRERRLDQTGNQYEDRQPKQRCPMSWFFYDCAIKKLYYKKIVLEFHSNFSYLDTLCILNV